LCVFNLLLSAELPEEASELALAVLMPVETRASLVIFVN